MKAAAEITDNAFIYRVVGTDAGTLLAGTILLDDKMSQQVISIRGSVDEITAGVRVTEISAISPDSFEDAVKRGVARATKTLKNVTSAWIKEQSVRVANDKIKHYQVNLMVTLVLTDSDTDDLA